MAEHTLRACLITNPRSGRGGIDLAPVLPVLRARGWGVTVRQKLYGGHATELAREAAARGYDVVVGCGGDGTIRQIIDGLVGTDVAIGVLPGGTVNLWAGELGVSRQLARAAMQLVGAERRRVDVGRVTINTQRGPRGHPGRTRHFLLVAGLGLDGAVMARLSKPLKNRIGQLAVGVAAVEALPRFKPFSADLELDGTAWQGRLMQIIVGNSRRYGGFTQITPEALIDDGLLDVCLFPAENALETGRQIGALLFRQRPRQETAQAFRVAALQVRVAAPVPLQLDGGAVQPKKKDGPTAAGVLYRFSVIAGGVSMLVPRGYAGDLFARRASPDPITQPAAPGNRHGHGQPGKRLMRINSVGADSFTAVRLRDGKVKTVAHGPDTVLEDSAGHEHTHRDAAHLLVPGRLVKVKGKKDRERGVIEAQHLILRDS